MPSDPLTTVLRLIAFAVDEGADENEARNMAMKACKLIHEHGLLKSPSVVRRAPRPEASPWTVAHVDDLMDDIFSSVVGERWQDLIDAEDRARQERFARARDRVAPEPPQHRVEGEAPNAVPPSRSVIISGQIAFCKQCRIRIMPGKLATWSLGEFFHPMCWTILHSP